MSSESAPRSSMNDASGTDLFRGTPSCSTMISATPSPATCDPLLRRGIAASSASGDERRGRLELVAGREARAREARDRCAPRARRARGPARPRARGRPAERRHARDHLGEAHRRGHLPAQQLREPRRGRVRLRLDVRHDRRARRRGSARRRQLERELLGGRRHQRAVERRRHGERHRALRAALGAPRAGAPRRPTRRPRSRSGAGVAVRGRHDAARLARGVAAQACATASGSAPSTAAIAPRPSGTASCMKRPRAWTSATASSKASAPAATSARVLAEAVARRRRPAHRAALLERAQQRDARGEDRGLLDLGAPQLRPRALRSRAATAGSRARRRPRRRPRARPPRRLADVAAHADLLGALPGEEQREHAASLLVGLITTSRPR